MPFVQTSLLGQRAKDEVPRPKRVRRVAEVAVAAGVNRRPVGALGAAPADAVERAPGPRAPTVDRTLVLATRPGTPMARPMNSRFGRPPVIILRRIGTPGVPSGAERAARATRRRKAARAAPEPLEAPGAAGAQLGAPSLRATEDPGAGSPRVGGKPTNGKAGDPVGKSKVRVREAGPGLEVMIARETLPTVPRTQALLPVPLSVPFPQIPVRRAVAWSSTRGTSRRSGPVRPRTKKRRTGKRVSNSQIGCT